jgi:hypothetical protein
MTAILRKLPFFDQPGTVTLRGTVLRVKAHQIIAWASLTGTNVRSPSPDWPRFPVIIDTGNTQRFSVRESHLRHWAGMETKNLTRLGTTRHGGRLFPLYSARLWLHENQPLERDTSLGLAPHLLEMPKGIVVYPDSAPLAPRLPLLGLRAMRENRLHLRIDGEKGYVSLRSSDWVTWLVSWG